MKLLGWDDFSTKGYLNVVNIFFIVEKIKSWENLFDINRLTLLVQKTTHTTRENNI